MKQHPQTEAGLPWREREFVTIADAAIILARSRTFIEREIAGGRLEGRRIGGTGPIGVTVRSLRRLVERAQHVRPTVFAAPNKPTLTLIVSRD